MEQVLPLDFEISKEDSHLLNDPSLPLAQVVVPSVNHASIGTVTTLSTDYVLPPPTGTVYGTIRLTSRSTSWFSISALREKYVHGLENAPLRTKCMSYAVIMFVADVTAQLITGQSILSMDWHRTFCLLMIGAMYTAPLYHFLYELLESRFPTKKVPNVALLVAVDQLLIYPSWLLGYFVLLCISEGALTVNAMKHHVVEDYGHILKTGWMVFPFVQVLNFWLVPEKLRVVVVASVGLLYNILLSIILNR